MPPHPTTSSIRTPPPQWLINRLLVGLSIFTMVMTVLQALAIWVAHRTAGISVLTWTGYLVSAAVWLSHGLEKRDKNIYLPCIGWILLDGAVIVGALRPRMR